MQTSYFRFPGSIANGLRRYAALGCLAAASSALGSDLVYHNGFEACWTHAITESQFLGAMRSAIDGVTSCVPQQDLGGGLIVCNTTACPGAATGCPVTTRANAFSGTFALGTSAFGASGSVDDITVPTTLGCSMTITSITNVTYTLDYTLQVDGNNGLYAASLDQSNVSVGAGYVPGGNTPTCATLATSLASVLLSQVEAGGSAGVLALETPATVGESVCPLTP